MIIKEIGPRGVAQFSDVPPLGSTNGSVPPLNQLVCFDYLKELAMAVADVNSKPVGVWQI